MNNAIATVDFFVDTLKQDVITLSMHSWQAENIGLKALDGLVVQAAAKGLLVEVWIEGERRDYGFGDYIELLKRESNRVDLNNPFISDDYVALHQADDDEERSFHSNAINPIDGMDQDLDAKG